MLFLPHHQYGIKYLIFCTNYKFLGDIVLCP